METSSPLDLLAPADRALLDLALNEDFKVRSLITTSSDAHPARRSLAQFLEWFTRPHIASAADFLIVALTHVDALSHSLTTAKLREGLEVTFTRAVDLSNQHPCTPNTAPLSNRLQRETRLLASAIKLLDPPSPASSRRKSASSFETTPNPTSDSAPSSSFSPHHTQPASTPSPASLVQHSLAALRQAVASTPRPSSARPTSPRPSPSFSPAAISALTFDPPPLDDLSERLQRLTSSRSRPVANLLSSRGTPR